MKRCDSFLFDPRTTPRPQWNTLKATMRFKGKFHTAAYFRSMREQQHEVLERAGFTQENYERWRIENRLVDNLSNRFRYVATLETGALGFMREVPGDIVDL
jgi:hypothetical protein